MIPLLWRWTVELARTSFGLRKSQRCHRSSSIHWNIQDSKESAIPRNAVWRTCSGEGDSGREHYILTSLRVCQKRKNATERSRGWKGEEEEERKEEKSTRIFRSAATYSPFVDRTAIIPYCSSNFQLLTLTLTPSFRPSATSLPPPAPGFPALLSLSLSLSLWSSLPREQPPLPIIVLNFRHRHRWFSFRRLTEGNY